MNKKDPEVHSELGRLEAMIAHASGILPEGRMVADAAALALKWLFTDPGSDPPSISILAQYMTPSRLPPPSAVETASPYPPKTDKPPSGGEPVTAESPQPDTPLAPQ